jgi:hypothetical protein
MMKRFLLVPFLCLLTVTPVLAQVRGGSVSGTVSDQQGGRLPGASVLAQGTDATLTALSSGDGTFRFLDLAPGAYRITATLDGFTTLVRENIIVAVGRNVELALTMNVAGVVETVNVTTAAPIVDPTASGTATNFALDELRSIPSSRDPFALARTVPGVLLDQVNVGGNLTGQQPLILAKGTRQQDTTWTLDGVEVTDMAAPGQSPTYFNFDNFEEIQVSTSGNDIRARTGGAALNFIVKRGTNNYHGGARGYFTSDGLESSNVPTELKELATPVTPATADHTVQNSDVGFDLGGPIVKDRAWFYFSYSKQDIRVFTRSTRAIDKTVLNNPNLKVNWQATKKDLFNFLFFNGYKIKDGRRASSAVSFEDFAATHHQDNAYSDSPLHGLFKVGDDRIIGSNMFLSAKYAYYNTGIQLTPEGGMDAQAGRSLVENRAYGSTFQVLQVRPQHSVTADVTTFVNGFGASHDVKFGVGYRRVEASTDVRYPGNGILAIEQAAGDLRAQVFRESHGANLVKFANFYVADRIARGRLTFDLGLRYDRQWGSALESNAPGSKAFPDAIPGVQFAGYETPFTWNNWSPRVGVNYALDQAGKTVARVSFSRFAGQLSASSSTVGFLNVTTASTPGNRTYRWDDLNGDRFAQADEVLLETPLNNGANGFNPNNPTSLVSTNRLDPNLKAPYTQTVVLGVEREVARNLAVEVAFTHARTGDLFGNLSANITPRVGVTLADYTEGATLTGTLPDGSTYSVPTFVADPAKFAASSGGFVTKTIPGYHTDFKGLEINLQKRLSDRWMGRLALSFNSTTEQFDDPNGKYDTNGNPTPTVGEPLQDGGQFAPTPSAAGGIYLNARWQFSANGMYQAPYGIDIAASIFGRQGYPFPVYRSTALGVAPNQETLNVLVSPKIDTFRLENVWNTDLRLSRSFTVPTRGQAITVRLIGDVFNLFNANTELARVNLITNSNGSANSTFNRLISNMAPRIVRFGLVLGF